MAEERKRLRGKKRPRLAQTELGRAIAKEMDAPAATVDSIVRRVAGEKLKGFPPAGQAALETGGLLNPLCWSSRYGEES